MIMMDFRRNCCRFFLVLIFLSSTAPCRTTAFVASRSSSIGGRRSAQSPPLKDGCKQRKASLSKLKATSATRSSSSAVPLSRSQQQQRRELLRKKGPHFKLDFFSGKVEFGSSFDLVTKFPVPNGQEELISQWILQEERVAMAIWDKDLIQRKGNSVFELKVMTLQFVTIQLSPTVNVKAWTDNTSSSEPVFYLQSVGFDPKISILPGIGMNPESLGIQIQVVGEMRPSAGGGVSGNIAFRSSGVLPPPLRVMPEPALRAASNVIVDTITKFAIASFEKSAIASFREFAAEKQQQRKEETSAAR